MKIRIYIFLIFLSFLFISNTSYAKKTTGVCGEHASYSFNEETGIMTISGSGEIYNN